MVEELFRGFLPEDWAARCDFSSLEKAPTSFVSDDQRERRGDVVWKLRWKQGGCAYLLLELQSTPDASMPVRLVNYAGLLLQDLIRAGALTLACLPVVLPVVFYIGRAAWRAPLDLAFLFGSPPPIPEHFLPRFRHVLVDARRMNLERPELASNLVAALLRVETCEAPEDFPPRVRHVLDLLSRQEDPGLRRTVTDWLRRKVHRVSSGGIMVPDLEDVAMLEETIQRWERQFIRQGRQEGIRAMRRILLRVMEERFGPLPASVRRHVNTLSSLRELERLTEKVLKAESLAQAGFEA